MNWPDLTTIIPANVKGNAIIRHFDVSEEDSKFSSLRAAINNRPEAYISVGKYIELHVDNATMMSDTPAERRSNILAVHSSKGDVLIAGLGLGMMLIPVCLKPEVKSVTVLEINPNVIDLVEPHIRKYLKEQGVEEKLTIINADAFVWKPAKGRKFDFIWFDIWPTICTDNLKEIKRLKMRFKNYKTKGSEKMQAWQEDQLRYLQRRGR